MSYICTNPKCPDGDAGPAPVERHLAVGVTADCPTCGWSMTAV